MCAGGWGRLLCINPRGSSPSFPDPRPPPCSPKGSDFSVQRQQGLPGASEQRPPEDAAPRPGRAAFPPPHLCPRHAQPRAPSPALCDLARALPCAQRPSEVRTRCPRRSPHSPRPPGSAPPAPYSAPSRPQPALPAQRGGPSRARSGLPPAPRLGNARPTSPPAPPQAPGPAAAASGLPPTRPRFPAATPAEPKSAAAVALGSASGEHLSGVSMEMSRRRQAAVPGEPKSQTQERRGGEDSLGRSTLPASP